jgi:hypothetical protein
MSAVLERALSGFWPFVGAWVLLGAVLHAIVVLWSRTMRMSTIRRCGWTPPHCDGDGDLKTTKMENEQ